MHRTVIATALALAAASSTLAVDVENVQFRQDFGPVTSSRTVNGAQTDIPTLYFEWGPRALELVTGDDGIQNPGHVEPASEAVNPLFEGRGGLASQISTLSYEFGPISVDASGGGNIVHRDIAVRNLVMQTTFGTYSTLLGEDYTFGSDAPGDDFFATGQVTWVTMDTIRLYLNGDDQSGDFFVFNGTWFTDSLVPAPGAAGLFGVAALGATRRRRR